MADVLSQDEWEQLQTAFPSLSELTQLPLRALVAYAARSARRVQPFFTLPDDHPEKQTHIAAVEQAIQAAEGFARGNPVAHDDYFRSAHSVVRVRGVTMRPGTARCAFLAGEAALYAVDAAAGAAKAARGDRGELGLDWPGPDGEPIVWPEGTHANEGLAAWQAWAVAAYWFVPANARAAAVAAWSDLDRLRRLGLGRFPEPGEPIDPSEDGPLGSLWPEETL